MLNISILQGRLTTDPELKTTQSGVSVTSFTIAVERSFVRQGEERQADFINIVAWRGTAEFICKYFAKGQMIAVYGPIQTRKYQDRGGNNRTAFEVVAVEAHFCGSKSNSTAQSQPAQVSTPAANDDFISVDCPEDIPF